MVRLSACLSSHSISGSGISSVMVRREARSGCMGCAVVLPAKLKRHSRIRKASSGLLATSAMPPALLTTSSHVCCGLESLPVSVFISSDANTASFCPTMSGVTSTVFQPTRSAEPLARPNCTGRPVRGSGSWPTWFLNKRTSGRAPTLSLMFCWMTVSGFAMQKH